MAQSAKKFARDYIPMYLGIFVFLIAGSVALYYHLTALAVVCFVLLGLCFIGAIVVGVLFIKRGNAEVDQIVREAKALNDQRRNG